MTTRAYPDPYLDFPIDAYTSDLQGWNHESPVFDHVINKLRPKLIIEVGTWKGASAIRMAKLLDVGSRVICVDTWLGDAETYGEPMAHEFGRPKLYQQFLANVMLSNLTDVIVPLPMDTLNAARILKGTMADCVYLDAAHDYESVLRDMQAYWPLVRPGGILFGDDYDPHWPGLQRAVQEFAKTHVVEPAGEFPGKWLLGKPKSIILDPLECPSSQSVT